jgi:Zn-finger nucleic acid-binding protein
MSDPAQATCPQCGGGFDDGPLCGYCHQGVRFAGEGFAFTKSALACPLCDQPLHQIDYHGVTIDTCGRCEGAWFDVGELEQVAQAARRSATESSFVATPTDDPGDIPRRERAYIPCPKCGSLMNRQNWERRSGVLVDFCKRCGVWLDGTELAQIRSFAASTPAGPPPPLPEPKPRPDPTPSVWSQDVQGYGGLGAGGLGARPGFGGILAELLSAFFGF